MKVTIIWTGTNEPSLQNQRIDVEEGCTVRNALGQAKVPTDNVTVNVDRQKGSLDQILGANSTITVTMTNLKGAAKEAVISFEEIWAFGTQSAAVGGDDVTQALAEVAEEGAKVRKQIVKELLGTMKTEAARVNANKAAAAKATAEAASEEAELQYASEQLGKGNPFSLIGFAGLKGYAYKYCDRMGCEVPASDSRLWATSPPKEK